MGCSNYDEWEDKYGLGSPGIILNVDMLRTFWDSLSVPVLKARSDLAVTNVSGQPIGSIFKGPLTAYRFHI